MIHWRIWRGLERSTCVIAYLGIGLAAPGALIVAGANELEAWFKTRKWIARAQRDAEE